MAVLMGRMLGENRISDKGIAWRPLRVSHREGRRCRFFCGDGCIYLEERWFGSIVNNDSPKVIRLSGSYYSEDDRLSGYLPCCRTRTVSDQSPNVNVIKTLRIFDSLFSVISIRMLWASSLSSVSQSWN